SVGAGQTKLGREKVLLSFENFIVTGFAGEVSFRGNFDSPLQRRYFASFLLTDLSESIAEDQSVGHVAQSGEDSLLETKSRFVAGGLSLAILADQSAAFEKRSGAFGGDAPRIGAAQGKGG